MTQEFEALEIAAVIHENADSCSIVLEVPEALRARFHYRAGQFLTFEIPWEDFSIRRCYSLSSAPEVDSAHAVTVKREQGGRMSNWIHDHLTPGMRIRTSPPEGRFVLNDDAGDAALTLFGAGSGITPVISLLKSALATTSRDVALFYANRSADSILFEKELCALESEYTGRLRVEHHFDDVSGFVSPDEVRRAAAGREEGEFYVCGPPAFMDVVDQTLTALAIPIQHAHFERFVSPRDPDREEPASSPPQPSKAPDSIVVRLSGRKHTVPYREGETLLAAAQRAGLKAPSSCEDGFCGSCMAQLVKGDLRMMRHEALTDHEVESGRLLLCQAIPTTADPILVDYDATSFTIAGSGKERKWPRLVGAGVFAFLCFAVWVLRSTG
jgi:3-ketosteroid 9alpha-monooxygenase subunit B